MSDQQPARRANVIRSPAFREIYANIINPRTNLYDCGVTFGYITSTPGAASLDVIVEEIHVTMSYGEAKYLVEALSRIVKAYEEEFGPIATQTFPPEVDDAVRATIEALKANRLQRGVVSSTVSRQPSSQSPNDAQGLSSPPSPSRPARPTRRRQS